MTHENHDDSTESTPRADNPNATTKEIPTVNEITYGWEGGLGNDDVPTLLSEYDLWDLMSADFLDEHPDIIDLNDLSLLPAQILASGSQILPDEDTDASTEVATSDESTHRSASRKRRKSSGFEASYPLKKVPKNALVGSDSVQMKPIKRMIHYLQETRDEDPNLYDTIYNVVQECELRHRRHENKYRHLPGAIFETLVETIGGPTFRRLYTLSKQFSGDGIHLNGKDADPLATKVDSSNNDTAEVPVHASIRSPLKTAFAYGFQKAAAMTKEDCARLKEDEESFEKASQECERTVSTMSDKQRNAFWDHFYL
ncbi:hypothetical protein FisN_19Hh090 [Fistulifera solaris]|uniref:Uncharacterized protein n=1 Tax=Fistulifera solaris TaxID=1519565 RepID=A0A1Z5JZR1_FISSO|nr:hypothetical protein FisN_19Hh090 [Fistulifera solaris]|eukprot:GAX19515.1 hypothetical protein FisN_19Hh090 [Fistulifera solaris]